IKGFFRQFFYSQHFPTESDLFSGVPFHYNDIEEFEELINKNQHKIAGVVMEPVRNDYPKNGFLEKIRKITEKLGIVLIFDEITAGFRLCTGGSHLVLDRGGYSLT
ncbi:MAG: aminotransferase class III-fold pyridoxal phosphate-dependent enzyme, partial [Lachnospiraceae bacterium]|nr:aminotransferase class III-fold pyridoxal phosphate-dependent enzyme [Lachnospiraceae bacterium]